MQRKSNTTMLRSIIAATLAATLVAVSVPVSALDLPQLPGAPGLPVGGTLHAAIAAPAGGSQFSRLDTIQFRDGSDATGCDIQSWYWEFGDGKWDLHQNPAHRYGALGAYTVKLTIVGACGDVQSASIPLTVVNLLPEASLSMSPPDPHAGDALSFDASGTRDLDGTVSSYLFTIDGVADAEQASSTYTGSFVTSGLHSVAVRAKDNDGGLSPVASLSFSVAAGPLASIGISPGTAQLPAGGAQQFAASGADAYGNSVPIAPSWSATCGSVDGQGLYHAPTSIGSCAVAAGQGALDAVAHVDVRPAALDTLTISGPGSVVVDSFTPYDVQGHDVYGNAVPLQQSRIVFHAPQQAGTGQVCASEQGRSACKDIVVLHDALWSIAVTGPASMAAGDTASFAAQGNDRFGNDVPLAQPSFDFTAPTRVGPALACTTQDGVQGCKSLSVVAGPLASIGVVGPDTMQAGHAASFTVQGSDAYGNAVGLAQGSFDYTAPTATGPAQACYAEQGVQGCKAIDVQPDSLASITVSGPAQLVAGESGLYGVSGQDQYGNAAPLSQSGFQFLESRAGPTQACYTEHGVSGCLAVEVVHAALRTIVASGPDSLVAGTTGTFHAVGFDTYGNDVPLGQASFAFTAPTLAGPADACLTEQGVTGCAHLQVVHDALSSIAVSGPQSVPAGTTHHYSVLGSDQYANAVPLGAEGFDWTSPTAPGAAQACFTEQGVTGCLDVTVGNAALAQILVSGPDSLVAGTSGTYTFEGRDGFGNSYPLATDSASFSAPVQAGIAQVCHTEQGVQGCKDVQVLAGPLAIIELSGPDSLVAGEQASYALSGADQHGNAVPLAQPSLGFLAPTQAAPVQVCYEELSVQGCKAVAVLAGPLASILVAGPDTLAAGEHGTYALFGFDAYGNGVALQQGSIDFARAQAGPAQVCFAEQGVQGCADLTVLAGALHDIAITGPDSVVVDTASDFGLAGSDAFGNAVGLAQQVLHWTAPSSVGTAQVCYAEQGVEACMLVQVVHDALVTITVSGPATLAAGQQASYALSGADQHGNPVALAQSALGFTAPTAAPGTSAVCYSEQGASGCLDVSIVAGPLARIAVSGPDTLVAGEHGTYALSGFDQYGNAVALLQGSLDFARTQAGPAQACYAELGVQGCHALQVLAGPLATIAMSGPGSVRAATSANYTLSGADAFGNVVPLAQGVLRFDAPTLAGPQQLCYAEQGVQACKAIQVLPGPLASIRVTGPAGMAAGSSADFALAGSDVWQNAVSLAQSTLRFNAPTRAGPAQACYSEQGVTGCAPVTVSAGPLSRLVLSPSSLTVNVKQKDTTFHATGSDAYANPVALPGPVAWSANLGSMTSGGVYSPTQAGTGTVTARVGNVTGTATANVVKTLTMRVYTTESTYHSGQSIRGVVHATYADGSIAPSTLITLTIRQDNPTHVNVSFQGINSDDAVRATTLSGKTNNFGDFVWTAPDSYNQPGDYRVAASGALNSNTGQAASAYHVTL